MKVLFSLGTHLFVIIMAGYIVIQYGCWWVNLLALTMSLLSSIGFTLVMAPDEPMQATCSTFSFKQLSCKFCGRDKKAK